MPDPFRTGFVKGPDWFDTGAHPKATFELTSMTRAAQAGMFMVEGVMTIDRDAGVRRRRDRSGSGRPSVSSSRPSAPSSTSAGDSSPAATLAARRRAAWVSSVRAP